MYTRSIYMYIHVPQPLHCNDNVVKQSIILTRIEVAAVSKMDSNYKFKVAANDAKTFPKTDLIFSSSKHLLC